MPGNPGFTELLGGNPGFTVARYRNMWFKGLLGQGIQGFRVSLSRIIQRSELN